MLQHDAVQKLKFDGARCEFWQISKSHFTSEFPPLKIVPVAISIAADIVTKA
jgi:hypothetical protein